MQALCDLIEIDSGWFDLSRRDINNHGQIVGAGTVQGARRAFLMTPIPAPERIPAVSEWGAIVMTLLLVTTGTIAIAWCRRALWTADRFAGLLARVVASSLGGDGAE